MNKIRSITIKGFRGQKSPIVLNLQDDANFLIGRNGTGKTTLINLIHDVLSLNTSGLREAKFDSVEITFKALRGRKHPRILVESTIGELGRELSYVVQESLGGEKNRFEVTRPIRRRVKLSNGNDVVTTTSSSPSLKMLRDLLSNIFKTSWLSLQRRSETIEVDSDPFDDDDRGSDVDQKLDQVFNDLLRYFSRLDRSVADQTTQFQQRWFLSFLSSNQTHSFDPFGKLDLAHERNALEAIFANFALPPGTYRSRLDEHFSLAAKAKEDLANRRAGIPMDSVSTMFDSLRLHTLVDEWQTLQEAKSKIYLPRTSFIETASSMLFRKNVEINTSNQLILRTDSGDIIPQRSLSSGEKQLLIFLGETLLQENKPYIFLADEPELSLHVEWQEELVPNLLKINPNAQVLFATHSPDIVNSYQRNVTRMEEITD